MSKTYNPVPHVMIDIETLSVSKSRAFILSVGAVRFTPLVPHEEPTITDPAIWLPNPYEQLFDGRGVDPETVAWWKDQPQEVKKYFLGSQSFDVLSMADLVKSIRAYVGESPVWSNGITFDCGNITNIAELLGEVPWVYSQERDYRTLLRSFPEQQRGYGEPWDTRMQELRDLFHDPVADSQYQVLKLWAHWPFPGASKAAKGKKEY